MICASCEADNPEGSRFCMRCGSPLALASAGEPTSGPTSPGEDDLTSVGGADTASESDGADEPSAPLDGGAREGESEPASWAAGDPGTEPTSTWSDADESWSEPTTGQPAGEAAADIPAPMPPPTSSDVPSVQPPPAFPPSGAPPAGASPPPPPPPPPPPRQPPAPPAGPPPGWAPPSESQAGWATGPAASPTPPEAPPGPPPGWGPAATQPAAALAHAPGAPGADDPHGLGVAVARLGGGSRKAGKVSFTVAAAVLERGETVDAAVQGALEGVNAAAVLTDRRLILTDERPWEPTVRSYAIDQSLTVQGWQDGSSATLTFVVGGSQAVLDRITDIDAAIGLAQRLRSRTGTG